MCATPSPTRWFFGNSGSEAVELGIKMIRKYHHASGNPHKTGIVCMKGAFHGRTLATIFAGGQQSHIEGFGPAVEGFRHVAFGNMNELRDAIDDETGGILFEPIQGEGGYRPAPDGFLGRRPQNRRRVRPAGVAGRGPSAATAGPANSSPTNGRP